jgi:hypothetical protein
MQKLAIVALTLLVVIGSVGCFGPQKLSRAVDDFTNQGYVETPWLYGNVISYWLISMIHGIAWWIDGIVNIYYFWVCDAQPFGKGVGTPFNHKAVTVPAGK